MERMAGWVCIRFGWAVEVSSRCDMPKMRLSALGELFIEGKFALKLKRE